MKTFGITVWLMIGEFVFVSFAVIGLIKIRTRSIKLKNLTLEQRVNERTKELNRANEQLLQADGIKNNILSIVSHEMKTPLCAIRSFSELIAINIKTILAPSLDLSNPTTQNTVAKIDRDLNLIISEVDRLATLINNLLNISKIESGKMDWKEETLDVSELIEHSLLITKPLIQQKGLAVQTNVEVDLPKISGDKDQLTQVLINLISNAVKFTKEGYIKVCAENTGAAILVSVEDTGVGIPDDQLEKIFEKFHKVESSIKGNKKKDNIGLGLYICKQLIENNGGRIWVESHLGIGSIFSFLLRQAVPEGNVKAV